MKQIPNYDKYYIDESGNIFRTKSYGMRQLKPYFDDYGHKYTFLSKNGKKKNFRVDNLVYKVYIGDKPKWKRIEYLDKDLSNTHYTNLRVKS